MLEAADLCLAVPGRTLVTNLSLRVSPGEAWGVLGPNGSGKTTLLHALAGLRRPQRGAVRLNGVDVHAMPRRALARQVGVLLQDEPASWWGNAADYVLLGRHPHMTSLFGPAPADLEASGAALQTMDLAGLAQRSLETLSGGERQRARIAQVLAQQPRLLLLDEPTQHLDLRHQGAALEAVAQRCAAGCATVMVLHDLLLASRHCSHVALLFGNGEALAGPAGALLAREHLERLFGCQLEEAPVSHGRAFVPA